MPGYKTYTKRTPRRDRKRPNFALPRKRDCLSPLDKHSDFLVLFCWPLKQSTHVMVLEVIRSVSRGASVCFIFLCVCVFVSGCAFACQKPKHSLLMQNNEFELKACNWQMDPNITPFHYFPSSQFPSLSNPRPHHRVKSLKVSKIQ